ncbi:MAG: matrixin family metalloprotease [Acidobacteria bacterium]|nr:matrixin family metalloprotease [Acidobacteriota bacterium]
MPRLSLLLLLAAFGFGVAARGYIRNERTAGVPYFQRDPAQVSYLVYSGTVAGLRNKDGELIITPDSSPTAAIAAAMERWNRVPGSALRFSAPLPTDDGASRIDQLNLVTFADDAFNRALVGGAIAVTRLSSDPDGGLTDTDVIFNPALPFSTTQAANTFDIEGTLAHELGHAIGLDHAGPVTSTMFATAVRGSRRLRTLTEDDRAFVREVYPGPDLEPTGALSGVVSDTTGALVGGALITAIDVRRNLLVGTIADNTGAFRLAALPPGEYALTAEPLDGPATVQQLGFSRRGADETFRSVVAGGPQTPAMTAVTAGATAMQDLVSDAGEASLNILGLATPEPSGEVVTRAGIVVQRGRQYAVQMHGPGLQKNEVTEDSLFFLGSGVSVMPDSFSRDTVSVGGVTYPRLRFQIAVAADAPFGSVTPGVATATDVAFLSAGIEIEPDTPTPTFSADGVVNAASFAGGPIAPGAIVSIFGSNLGPSTPALGAFDTVNGALRSELEETAVFFQETPAPLFYADSGQINAQVPATLTPGNSALVRIVRQGVSSAPAVVSVAGESPGLFTLDGRRAAALNQDGSLNTLESPAAAGTVVTLYATGQGAVEPVVATGMPAGVDPLSRADGVEVLVDGRSAEILFAGLAPGFVGLLQVNVRLPADVPAGERSLELRIRGAQAAEATLAVR